MIVLLHWHMPYPFYLDTCDSHSTLTHMIVLLHWHMPYTFCIDTCDCLLLWHVTAILVWHILCRLIEPVCLVNMKSQTGNRPPQTDINGVFWCASRQVLSTGSCLLTWPFKDFIALHIISRYDCYKDTCFSARFPIPVLLLI